MSGQITVLHVDDDPDFLEVSSQLFARGETFNTLTAPTAEDGLRILKEQEVDCLVSDFVLSTDGRPFISVARDVAIDVPIILFTGKEWESVSERALGANITEYIQKSGIEQIESVKHRIRYHFEGGDDAFTAVADNTVGLLPPVGQTTTLAVSAATLGEEWEFIGQHDWETVVELGTVIIDAFEDFTGEDTEAFAPLFESIDADALEELLRPAPNGEKRQGIQVRFPYMEYEFAVASDGVIAIRTLD